MMHSTINWGTLTCLDEGWKGKDLEKIGGKREGISIRGLDNHDQEFKAEHLKAFSLRW